MVQRGPEQHNIHSQWEWSRQRSYQIYSWHEQQLSEVEGLTAFEPEHITFMDAFMSLGVWCCSPVLFGVHQRPKPYAHCWVQEQEGGMPWCLLGRGRSRRGSAQQQQHKLSLEAVQAQTVRTRQAVRAVSAQPRGGCSVLELDPASQPSDWGDQAHSGFLDGQQQLQSSAASGAGESRADGAAAGPHRLAVGRWILTQQMLHQERRLSAGQHRYLSLLGAHAALPASFNSLMLS